MTTQAIERPAGLGWGVMTILLLGRLACNTAFRLVYPLLAFLAVGLAVEPGTASLLVTVQVSAMLLSPLGGALADARGERFAMLLGLGAYCAGALVCALSSTFGPFMVGYGLIGLGTALYMPSSQAYATARSSYAQRGRVLGLLELSWALAALVGVTGLTQLVEAQEGWAPAYWALLGLGGGVLLLTLTLGEQGNRGTQEQRNRGTEEQGNGGTQEQGNTGTGERGNTGTQEHRNTGTQEHRNRGTQEHRNTGTEEQGNTGTQEHRNSWAAGQGNRGTAGQPGRGTGEQPGSRAGEPGNRGTAGQPGRGTGEPGNSWAAGQGNRGTAGQPGSRAGEPGNSRAAGQGNRGTGEPGNRGIAGQSERRGRGEATMSGALRQRGVAAAMGFIFSQMLAAELVFVVYALWLQGDFGASTEQLGLIYGLLGFVELAGSLGATLFTDRIGKRRAVLAGFSAVALIVLLLPLSGGRWGLFLLLFLLFDLCFEFAVVSIFPLISGLAHYGRGTVLAAGVAASGLGRVVGSLLGPQLFMASGFGANGTLAAAVALAGVIMGALLVREGQA